MTQVDLGAISTRSLLGLSHLIVFGSVVAFSAYTWLLERCSATLVATHTDVNPVIAVLLGWLFAGEGLTPRVIGATGLILSAVLLLKSSAAQRRTLSGEAVSTSGGARRPWRRIGASMDSERPRRRDRIRGIGPVHAR